MKLWKMTIIIQDNKKKLSRMLLYYPYNYNGADSEFPAPFQLGVDGVINHTLPVLDQLIKGKIVDVTLSLKLDLPAGLKAFPDPDSDVEEGAIFKYYTAWKQFYFEHRIPTFDESLFTTDSKKLSSSDAGLDANVILWGEYICQPEDSDIEPYPGAVTNRGDDLIYDFEASESFIKSGKS